MTELEIKKKIKKILLIFVIFNIILVFSVLIYGNLKKNNHIWNNTENNLDYSKIFSDIDNMKYKNICIEENICFEMEFAITDQQRQKWLGNRASLWELSGMFFVFPNSWKYKFWMKDTLIWLDIIWLDDKLNVLDFVSLDPCEPNFCPSFGPNKDSSFVLEINKWLVKKYNIKKWDKFFLK